MSTEAVGAGSLALQAVRSGELPARAPDRMWAGPGLGSACAICRVLIRSDEIELELEFVASDGRGAPDCYFVHRDCYWALEQQRQAGRPT